MNAMPRIAILSLSLVGLAACTSAGTRSTYIAPTTVAPAASNEVRSVRDDNYVAGVEWIARQRGVQVHWVNPPVKRVYASR